MRVACGGRWTAWYMVVASFTLPGPVPLEKGEEGGEVVAKSGSKCGASVVDGGNQREVVQGEVR